jgi:hypothetical protein
MYHHQPINVPTAGAQAFLMDYPQGKRAITHYAGPVRIGGSLYVYNMHNIVQKHFSISIAPETGAGR